MAKINFPHCVLACGDMTCDMLESSSIHSTLTISMIQYMQTHVQESIILTY